MTCPGYDEGNPRDPEEPDPELSGSEGSDCDCHDYPEEDDE